MDVKRVKPTQRLLGNRNILIAIGVISAVAVFATLLNLGKALPTVTRANLWMDVAKRGEMVYEIRISGTLVPRDIRWITSSISANVQEVLVQPGTAVQADTVIMRLVNPALETNLTKAKAVWAGAEADLAAKRSALISQGLEQKAAVASSEAAFEISRVKAEAIAEAFTLGAISKMDFKNSQITLEQNRHLLDITKQRKDAFDHNIAAQLRAAEAQRDQARSVLEVAKQEADALNVKAGIAGILQQVTVELGQQVTIGASIAKVANPFPLVAHLKVPEIQAKNLSNGLQVLVDTHSGIAEGEIAQIDPAVRNGSVLVYVNFKSELPSGVRPDLSIDGRIILNKLHDVVSIARPTLAATNTKGKLFVLSAGSDIAHRKSVVYGAVSSDRAEIVEGVAASEQVILSDVTQWSDYEALRLE